MAKTKGFLNKEAHIPIKKGSSQGRRPNTSTMNKKKRQGRTKKQLRYRGQGRLCQENQQQKLR